MRAFLFAWLLPAALWADEIPLAPFAQSSPEFQVERRYLNFEVCGPRDVAERVGVELLAAGKPVRASCATDEKANPKAFFWRTFDLADWQGKAGSLRLNGAVQARSFAQSDHPKGPPTDALTEVFRPRFHYTAASGWLNDANGLLYYGGTWHLFHQHRPPGGVAIGWGHATSSDLLHWQRQPMALPPSATGSNYSGSAVIDWTNASGLQRTAHPPILLAYTVHPNDMVNEKCTQNLAYSTDGARTFQPYAGNPVLRTEDSTDRDPKLFFYAPSKAWFLVLSLSRNNTEREQATYGLFRSWDLNRWQLQQKIGPGNWYWDCPDMFELPVEGGAGERKWILMKGSGDYLVGTLDGETFRPETEPIRTHWGGNFYGAQTFTDAPGGRRVHIGWMSTGDKVNAPNAYPGMPFNQQMSFPREITLRPTAEGPRLFREPIREIAQLYEKTTEMPAGPLGAGANALAAVPRRALLDLEMTLAPGEARTVRLMLGGEEVVYEPAVEKMTIRDKKLSVPLRDGKLQLRALLDTTSLELFANHGEFTYSLVFFHDPETTPGPSLTAEGGAAQIEHLVVRELKPAPPQ